MPVARTFFAAALLLVSLHAAAQIQSAPVPPEMSTSYFAVAVNNQRIDVTHAAAHYEFVSFDTTGPSDLSITAADPHFWDSGVDIEPWRLGLRATHPPNEPQTIRIHLNGPAKLSISRPGDFLNDARILFVFAGSPPPPPPSGPNVTIVPPGLHTGSLNPKSGDTLYLAPGAFILGSLNLWQVENVHVLGRGTIVYDGPQIPGSDEGWMQKPDWHCIEIYQSRNIQIEGLTCIVRSRTWQIQMKDSHNLRFNDLRVIGGHASNANQDGMDWLGSGDTLVDNSFLRASDDDLAILGNWDGYTEEALTRPGPPVENVTIQNSQLSTSISNVVRLGWPSKVFDARNITLRNIDVLHAGLGACGQTFALLAAWGANNASGDRSQVTLENIFLDHWYSLFQLEQHQPALHAIALRNIWALDQPPLAPSTLMGDVKDITLDNIKLGQARIAAAEQLPLSVSDGAAPPLFAPAPALIAAFTTDPSTAAPGQKITFTANEAPGATYEWLFGDGSRARGRVVRHRFSDALGTALDGSNGAGRFRVLLHVTDSAGHEDWAAQGIVAVSQWHEAQSPSAATQPGLNWKLYSGAWTELPDLSPLAPTLTGSSVDLSTSAQTPRPYATAWEGFLRIPASGGYTFHLIDRDGARLVIDGLEIARTGRPFPQVCGSPGNAERYSRGSIGLRPGLHSLRVEALNSSSDGPPRLLWEGPSIPLADLTASALSHPAP